MTDRRHRDDAVDLEGTAPSAPVGVPTAPSSAAW